MVEYTDQTEKKDRLKLGELLVSKGYVTESDVDRALSEQRLRIGEVLIRSDRITAEQLHAALDHQKKEAIKIGAILKDMGYIKSEDLDWALERMKRRLGEILIELGVLKDQDLQRALALQLKVNFRDSSPMERKG